MKIIAAFFEEVIDLTNEYRTLILTRNSVNCVFLYDEDKEFKLVIGEPISSHSIERDLSKDEIKKLIKFLEGAL